MLNVLFADDNMDYIKNVANLIFCKNEKVRLVKIANNVREAIECIKECKIDLVFLDLLMPFGGGWKLLEMLEEENYGNKKPKIIVISGDNELVLKIRDKYDIQDAISKDCGINNTISRINKNIDDLIKIKNIEEYERRTYEELINLKYNTKYKGTKYIIESVIYIMENINNSMLLENLEKNVYPIIACKHQKSTQNIKGNIVKATNNMYMDCNLNYLLNYFNYTMDTKPTPKVVISTIVNKLLRK